MNAQPTKIERATTTNDRQAAIRLEPMEASRFLRIARRAKKYGAPPTIPAGYARKYGAKCLHFCDLLLSVPSAAGLMRK